MSRDDDRTWAELVDSFHSAPAPEGDQPWPAAEEIGPDEEQLDDFRDASVTLGPLPAGQRPHRDPDLRSHDDHEDDGGGRDSSPDDHFVPPPPAPIPRGDAVSRLAWAGVIAGPVGLIMVAILSWSPPDELVLLAVMAFIGGFVTLIARMRGHHPNDPDDGAVL